MKNSLRYFLVLAFIFMLGKLHAQTPNWQWAVQPPFNVEVEILDVVSDAAGFTYVTGSYSTTITVGASTLSSNGPRDAFVAKFSPAGVGLWAAGGGGAQVETGRDITVDNAGNVYVTGVYEGNFATFGGTTLFSTSSFGPGNLFVTKLDGATGNFLWTSQADGGSAGFSSGYALEVDNSGNLFVAGQFSSATTTNFGSGVTLTNPRGVFLARYNAATGTAVWARSATGDQTDEVQGLALDNSGNIIITGAIRSTTTTFIGTPSISITNSSGFNSPDVYIAKYNAAGNVQWVNQGSSNPTVSGTSGYGISTDAVGNIYVSGIFDNSISFTGAPALTSNGGNDGFVIKYGPTGTFAWVQAIGGTGVDASYSLVTDATTGTSHVIGTIRGAANFGGGPNVTASAGGDIFVAEYTTAGAVNWVQKSSLLAGDYSEGRGIATDGSGNIYVTGFHSGQVAFGATTLNTFMGVEFKKGGYVAKLGGGPVAQPVSPILQCWNWGQAPVLGTGPLSGQIRSTSITSDFDGNTYITGTFSGTVQFGSTTITSSGTTDFFIAKYDSAGVFQWVKTTTGGTGVESGNDVKVDPSGNVYVIGDYSTSTTFGQGASAVSLTSTGFSDVFIAKYDNAGNLLWIRSVGGATGSENGQAVSTDGAGNVYVTGSFPGTANFSGTILTAGTPNPDAFVAKYDPSGTLIWVRQGGAAFPFEIATSASGNSYISGAFTGTATFGGLTVTSVTPGSSDAFLAKYDASGTIQWLRSGGGNAGDIATSIGLDPSENVYIAGNFSNTANFSGQTVTSNGQDDIFIAKYNSAGAIQWARSGGGTSVDFANDIAVDIMGNAVVTGSIQSTVTFGTTTYTANSVDLFVAVYDASGAFKWLQNSNGSGTEFGTGVAIDGAGKVYSTGVYAGSGALGSFSLLPAPSPAGGSSIGKLSNCSCTGVTASVSISSPTGENAYPLGNKTYEVVISNTGTTPITAITITPLPNNSLAGALFESVTVTPTASSLTIAPGATDFVTVSGQFDRVDLTQFNQCFKVSTSDGCINQTVCSPTRVAMGSPASWTTTEVNCTTDPIGPGVGKLITMTLSAHSPVSDATSFSHLFLYDPTVLEFVNYTLPVGSVIGSGGQPGRLGISGPLVTPGTSVDFFASDGDGDPVINSYVTLTFRVIGTPASGCVSQVTSNISLGILGGGNVVIPSDFGHIIFSGASCGCGTPPNCNFTISPGTTVSSGVPVTFTAANTSGTHYWRAGDNNGQFLPPIAGTVSHTYTTPGTYTVEHIIQLADGSSSVCTQQITVTNAATCNAGADVTICTGQSTTLNVAQLCGANDPNRPPVPGCTTTPPLPPAGFDCNACTASITGGGSQTINNGQKVCIQTGDTYNGGVTLNAGGRLVVCGTFNASFINFNGGELIILGSATIQNLNVNNPPNAVRNFGQLTVQSSFNLNGIFENNGTANINTSLNINGPGSITNTGTLNITGSMNNNGAIVNTGTIVVNGNINNNGGSSFTNQCTVNASGTISGTPITGGTGSTNITYSWSPSTGLSSTTVASPVATPAATTTYTVTVNDLDNSRITTGTVTVTVNNCTPPDVSGLTQVCMGQQGVTYTTPVIPGAVSYNWWSNGTTNVVQNQNSATFNFGNWINVPTTINVDIQLNVAPWFIRKTITVVVMNCGTREGKFIGEESALAERMELFPNPSSDEVYFRLSGSAGSTLLLEVTDMNGKVLIHNNGYTEGETWAFGSELPAGTYFVKIYSETNNKVMKFVKFK